MALEGSPKRLGEGLQNMIAAHLERDREISPEMAASLNIKTLPAETGQPFTRALMASHGTLTYPTSLSLTAISWPFSNLNLS